MGKTIPMPGRNAMLPEIDTNRIPARTEPRSPHDPVVSFMVPCYRLAHLLPDCLVSILSQTYENFEILVMDDCSPDNTPEVARSFNDSRVIHVRNEPNLGHLRNYNKGIRLCRGKYVWLISADDYLRRPYILQRYVEVLEKHPNVGYTFCAGVGVRDGRETGLLEYSQFDTRDRIMSGHAWLKQLLVKNIVLAPSGLVRRECYEQLGGFPLDMPWAGDWYLWLLYALHSDVAYFAEPMVCYRQHGLSMTNQLNRNKAVACRDEEFAIQWDIKRRADEAGFHDVSRACLRSVALLYGKFAASKTFGQPHPIMTVEEIEASLQQHAASEDEKNMVLAETFADMASRYYLDGDVASAKRFYDAAFRVNPFAMSVIVKRALLSLGATGDALRTLFRLLAFRS